MKCLFVQEDDPNDVVPQEWVETTLSREVMAEEAKLPEHLKTVKDEDVSNIFPFPNKK